MKYFSSLAILFACVGAMIIAPGEATASATGCDNRQLSAEPVDPHAIAVDIKAPYGYLCHLIHTNGKQIKEQKAAFTTNAGIYEPLVKDVCNWRLDFIYYDTRGEEYMTDQGETVSGCKQGASRQIAKAKTLPEYGSTCATLFVDGEPRLTQCHTINEIE